MLGHIIAFMVGVIFGFFIASLCVAAGRDN